ncbi:MAG: glycosyltransferase family 2 protein, partial [Planctomycetota bacterium]
MSPEPKLSLVVPFYNERDNVEPLHAEIASVGGTLEVPWEAVYVDDGSTDGTYERLLAVRESDPGHVDVIRLRRNFGQTAALAAGFKHAQGEVVVTLDGDLQNDPADIPRLLEGISNGYDVVSGWRKRRRDPFLSRRLPSQIANKLVSWMTGVPLHDHGCTLKAYRREVLEEISLYGEMHRFLPAQAQ